MTYCRHCDPEAAEICFQAFPQITLVSWEMTVSCTMPWSWYDVNIMPMSNSRTKFIREITTFYEELQRAEGLSEFNMCDAVAMAALLRPSLVTVRISLKLGGFYC